MITPTKISQWLMKQEPIVGDAEKSALAALSKSYPYFVPSKYIEASLSHTKSPFAPALLNKMRLFMGDWVSFHYFLQDNSVSNETISSTTTENIDQFDDHQDEETEYFFDTIDEEQEAMKDEVGALPTKEFDMNEADDFEFEEFNEREQEEHSIDEINVTLPSESEIDLPKENIVSVPIPEIIESSPIIEETKKEVEATIQVEPTTLPDEIIPLDTPQHIVEEASQIGLKETIEEKLEHLETLEAALSTLPNETPNSLKEEIIVDANLPELPTEPENTGSSLEPMDEELTSTVPMISFGSEKMKETTKEELLIQPLYTEDYFLHQGVENIASDNQEEDKQLMVVMSFADWLMYFKTKTDKEKEEEEDQKALKTMWQKEKLAAALEEENEEIPEGVFEMAVNSIKIEDDLASESLAEILIKQGKFDKAIEMYRKLSLRNPQKNTYFATKIEKLLKEK